MTLKQLIDILKRFPEITEPKIQIGQINLPITEVKYIIGKDVLILSTKQESE